MIAFVVVGAVLAYVVITACVYRHFYKKVYAEYLRWKNRDPEKYVRVSHVRNEKQRQDVTWAQYLRYSNITRPAFTAGLWLPLLFIVPINRFLHPEVKVPDQPKISELENL